MKSITHTRPASLIDRIRRMFSALRALPQMRDELTVLRQDHDATVAWLRTIYPEIVAAVGKKLDEARFATEQREMLQDILSILHTETGRLAQRLQAASGPSDTSAAAPAAAEGDYRMTGFYMALERGFRGTPQQVEEKLLPYLHWLPAAGQPDSRIIDIGCGRGEWLQLLKKFGFHASGVDLNPINGDDCRTRSLDVHSGDAIDYLAGLPAESIDVVTAFHLIEHLPFPVLLTLTDAILRVLRPGGLLIYETPNPENLLVATRTFWYDPTHLRLLPPELIEFLVTQRGFVQAEILRLHPADIPAPHPVPLDALLDGPRDFALIARKPVNDPPTPPGTVVPA